MTYAFLLCLCSDNSIGAEGARALAESLKKSTTLTELNLRGMLELHELLFVTARWDITHNLCVFPHLQ